MREVFFMQGENEAHLKGSERDIKLKLLKRLIKYA